MNRSKVGALLMLMVLGPFAAAQQPPGHGSDADPNRQSPGLSDPTLSVEALLKENARLKEMVALLRKKVELLEARLRTLEESQ
mgnify:CR=1 FL=1